LVTFNNNIQPIIVPTKDTHQERSSGTNNHNNDSNGKLINSIKERKDKNGTNATDSLDEKSDFPIISTFGDCSDNDSTYTTITISDCWDIKIDYRRRSNEPICLGNMIEYYCPIYPYGDQQGLHKATVVTVDPKNEMRLS
jgi:hypothetical protein